MRPEIYVMGEEGRTRKKDNRSEIPEVPQWLFLLIGVLVVDFLPKCVKNVNSILINGIMDSGHWMQVVQIMSTIILNNASCWSLSVMETIFRFRFFIGCLGCLVFCSEDYHLWKHELNRP